MGAYGLGFVNRMMAIQEPLKRVLSGDVKQLVELVKEFRSYQPIDKVQVRRDNTPILIEAWEEEKRHFSDLFMKAYVEPFLDKVVYFCIGKLDYDNWYYELAQHYLGYIISRGWHLPKHNRPSSALWNNIPLDTRRKLEEVIRGNYLILQDRLKVIDEKFGVNDAEGNTHKESRYSQFVNRVLDDIEREVILWH